MGVHGNVSRWSILRIWTSNVDDLWSAATVHVYTNPGLKRLVLHDLSEFTRSSDRPVANAHDHHAFSDTGSQCGTSAIRTNDQHPVRTLQSELLSDAITHVAYNDPKIAAIHEFISGLTSWWNWISRRHPARRFLDSDFNPSAGLISHDLQTDVLSRFLPALRTHSSARHFPSVDHQSK